MYCVVFLFPFYLFYISSDSFRSQGIYSPPSQGGVGGGAAAGWSYLIFSVIIVMAARMMVIIQKRNVIFDSWNCLCGQLRRI